MDKLMDKDDNADRKKNDYRIRNDTNHEYSHKKMAVADLKGKAPRYSF